ncbi:unnamed protein product [Arabidopsis arenosa]|uniref:RNase H type-1 domain-containing protein n=1 Tax=Arabidopsis arenosa TaxID=38785 RepID=A0A8S1ZMI9_ARAAE|nr:unnamed protein product [Arabidopsis arenosa]
MYWVLNLENECPQLKEQAILVPWLLWRLWKNRNELLFKDREFGVEEVLRRVKEDAAEWQMRKEENRNSENIMAKQTNGKWRSPPAQWVKCNTDAAWQSDGHLCGLGWVLRNDKSRVLWIGARALPKLKNVLEAELEALRWAVIMMSRFNYKKIIFESDAKSLIDLLNKDEDWPSLRPSLQDIRAKLQLFEEVKFQYTPRGGNSVADRVARESLSFTNYDPKLYSVVPSWLKNSVDLEYGL